MIPIYSEQEFKKTSSKSKLPLLCKKCNKKFFLTKHKITQIINKTTHKTGNFCSNKCQRFFEDPPIFVKCKKCDIKFKKQLCQIKKSKNHFCSRSCAATYNNLHKTTGTRRSKLEVWIEEQLTSLYPNLDIEFNQKKAIKSELDIYIPSLSLAFELNGIYHYKPIHGQDKYDQIQNNDNRKFAACLENDIDLCIIDTSQQKYVKPKTSQKYLDIITSIIMNKMVNPWSDLNRRPLDSKSSALFQLSYRGLHISCFSFNFIS